MKRTPLRKHGNPNASKDSAWYYEIIDLWNCRCAVHGCANELDKPHHLLGKKAWPRYRHDLNNGISLCRKHHDWAHNKPAEFKQWLMHNYPLILEWMQEAKRAEAERQRNAPKSRQERD